jgi:hypothetical protein
MALSIQDLEDCQNLINELSPGVYELKEIYGEHYETIRNPKSFGKQFRKAVKDGLLLNIRESHIDPGDKHWRYVLHDTPID